MQNSTQNRYKLSKLMILLLIFLNICIFSSISYAKKSAFRSIAEELSTAANKLKNKTVAILPFETTDRSKKDTGKYIADKITHELVSLGKLSVVERAKIDRILKEQELSVSGIVDAGTVSKIGELLAVDALIMGSARQKDNSMEILARLVDSGTGKVLKTASAVYKEPKTGETGFTGTWNVIKTGPYFLKKKMRYQKLVLNEDNSYELVLINNTGRVVLFKGYYMINGNNIDYKPHQLYFDGRLVSRPRGGWQKGTIYLIDGKLHFTVTDMRRKNKRRLNARDSRFAITGKRK
ncbi:MAG: hypothetical protein GY754_23335 [bacterium]|nr:hypothetical protein [bacterium]